MPSFRDEAVNNPAGAPAHLQPATNQSTMGSKKWVNTVTQSAANRSFRTMVDANPDIGPGLERLVQDYPTLSRDTAVAIAMSGQANILPAQLLDDLAEMDRRKQAEAATENPMWRTAKAASRRFFLVAEDLYNVSPLLAVPRVGINMYQGKTLRESAEIAGETALGTEIQMERLGFSTDYGSGFLPAQELLPDSAGFWAGVKNQLIAGEFSGSTEEQIIEATNRAQIEQARTSGLNPNALAVEQRNSTLISRTYGDQNIARPYSPGAAIMMPFTTPGTRAYDTFSGLLDGAFRVTLEPIDLPLDNAGDLIMAGLNPRVTRNFMTAQGRGSALMRDVLKEAYGVDVVLDPIVITHADGTTTTGGAKGATYNVVDEAGNVRIEVDPQATADQYGRRLTQDGTWNMDSVYGRAYADRGLTPEQVRDTISAKGGENGEFFLTVEHELVHANEQRRWFGTTTLDDGTVVVNYDDVLDAAPAELREAAAKLKADDVSMPRVAELNAAVDGADEAVLQLELQQSTLERRLGSENLDGEYGVAIREQLDELEIDLENAKRAQKAADDELVETVRLREAAKNEIRDFQEVHAINTAWDNMTTGKWKAEEAWKKYKKKAGLTNFMRPWVNPKSVDEWMSSRLGKRTLDYFSGIDNIETIRKHAPYLSGEQVVKLADATTPGEVSRVISEAFEGGGISTLQRPTIGLFTDSMAHGLDGWQQATKFLGGPVGRASTRMGIYTRRLKASVGNHILSATDLNQTLDSINSSLATMGATAEQINSVQRLAIRGHGTVTGLDEVYDRIQTISKQNLKKQGGGLYTDAEIDKIWSDWQGYDIINRHYWASSAGKDRNWMWNGRKYVHTSEMKTPGLRPQSFMEAQFATTHRTLPDIRRTRRLYSRQRTAYERTKRLLQQNSDPSKRGWQPKGFDTTEAMAVGDWTFGLWRDMQLMRGGWAARIIPEEQLRFGASGFSGLFSNPVDYFLSMFNRLDFTIPGDEITLQHLMDSQEALGTGGLRDLRYPPHVVSGDAWDIANRTQHPQQFWGGMSREFLMDSQDQVVSRVAQMGPDQARLYFKTEEGRAVLRSIAADAAPDNPLSRVARDPKALDTMIDVSELRIAQITGGEGLWFNPELGEYVDLYDGVVPKASDRVAFPNEQAILDEITRLANGDQTSIVGLSHRSRADLEAALNSARGYDLDALAEAKRAAVVTVPGNADLRKLIADKQLDDILIEPEMPFHQVRAMDQQLEAAFTSRGVNPPENWPVARGELTDPLADTLRNNATDTFFKWFNQIPSKKLNRQPFFQQAFGAKLAEAYYYGDSKLRKALDEVMTQNPSLRVAFDVGKRKTFRDLGVNRFPKAFDGLNRDEARKIDNYLELEAPPQQMYNDAVDDGRYDMIPLSNDPSGMVTVALMEALEQAGVQQAVPTNPRGIFLQRNPVSPDEEFAGFPGLVFTGTDRVPAQRYLRDLELEPTHGPIDFDLTEINDLDGFPDTGLTPEQQRATDIARQHKANPGSLTNEEVEWAARELGWRDTHRSGGLSTLPYRTSINEGGYGTHTDIFRVDHLEPDLQRHLAEEGDIEQLFVLDPDRYPELAKIKQELVPVYNRLRRETRWKLNAETLRRYWGDDITMSQQRVLDTADEIREILPDIPIPDQRYGRSFERTEAVVDWMKETFTGPGGEGRWGSLLEQLQELGLSSVPQNRTINHTFENLSKSGLILNDTADDLLTLLDDPASIHSQNIQWPMAQQMIENELGYKLTPAQANEFKTQRAADGQRGISGIWERRAYQPDETLLAMEPIQPVARLPHATVSQLLEHGLMIEQPRQLGDAAMILDQNTTKLGQRAKLELEEPFHQYIPETLFDDPRERRIAWAGFVRGDGYDAGDYYLANEAIDSHLASNSGETTIIAMGDEGPFVRKDFATWISSKNFRAFSYAAHDDLVSLQDEVSQYLQELHAAGVIDHPQPERLLNDPRFLDIVKRINDGEKSSYLIRRGYGEYTGSVEHLAPSSMSDDFEELAASFAENPVFMQQSVEIHLDDIARDIQGYEDGASVLMLGMPNKGVRHITEPSLGRRVMSPEAEAGTLRLNTQAIPQDVRNETTQRFFQVPDDGTRWDWGETGGPSRYTSDPTAVEQVEMLMKAAKSDAIDETKDLFYDLTNKSNVADALKFIFPFGDAWYEVLSRWAKIMNPVESGGQSFRNVRRVQQTWNAARESGFLSTNEYGEEVFNWPISPGNLVNAFIPNETNIGLKGSMPISSLMFIDPTARGIGAPGTSPIVQLSAQFAAPRTENIPLFGEALQWLAYGAKDEYRPGEIESLAEVQQGFQPTVINRMAAAVFNEQHRESMGNTKLRLFQSLGISGDPRYDFASPSGAQAAWDIADTVGTALSWLRIIDAWTMPGQPQYSAQFQGVEPEDSNQMTADEMLAEASKESPEAQVHVVSVLRAAAEYRHARDIFGDAEADMYMIERYGVLPSFLQSASTGLVERPTTWGGTEWVDANEWLLESAPLTLAGTVPADADDTFNSQAWNNLFGEFLEVDGVENQPIRRRKSPSELAQSIERGMGYDQVRFQNELYDRAVEELRRGYGPDYASMDGYRAKKLTLDQLHRDNIEKIYTEFTIVRGSNQGNIIGSANGVTTRNLVDEIIDIGTPGTRANSDFNQNVPHLADVAENYAEWFMKLEAISRMMDRQKASGEWWMNAESDDGKMIRQALAAQSQVYMNSLTDPDAIAYAKWLNRSLLDPLIDEWEWIDSVWTQELESYPSIAANNTITVGGS